MPLEENRRDETPTKATWRGPARRRSARQDESAVRIIFLSAAQVAEPWIGGKARGLVGLQTAGLKVPEGFVLVGGAQGLKDFSADAADRLQAAYVALGSGRVAVRSSALDEDGQTASFAGQYETKLNVEGVRSLLEAVQTCLQSGDTQRARLYRAQRSGAPPVEHLTRGCSTAAERTAPMAVVVQRMVDARTAGVLFTADPVSGRRDRIILDAIEGVGEALVAGRRTPDHFVLDRRGSVQSAELTGRLPLLTADEMRALVRDALQAEKVLGRPLDLEWALDRNGQIYWLQARPITTLAAPLDEMDTPAHPEAVYTRANFGEMMPGAMCPLTISTTAFGIDQGIQQMLVHCGVNETLADRYTTVAVFNGHIFFNLSSMLPFCAQVGGSDPKQLMLAICGQTLSELKGLPPASRFSRFLKGVRYAHYAFGADGAVRAFEAQLERFSLQPRESGVAQYHEIDSQLHMLIEAYKMHLRSSAASGMANGVLHQVLAGGSEVNTTHEARLAELLRGTPNIESAGVVEDLDRVICAIERDERAVRWVAESTPTQALAWLQSGRAGKAGECFRGFLHRHGHRALRELSMRQPGWRDDPRPLVQSLATTIRARCKARQTDGADPVGKQSAGPFTSTGSTESVSTSGLSWVLKRIVTWTRATVRRREYTKGLLVETTDRFKKAYRRLGALLVADGLLPDADLVFFFTHRELGKRIYGFESAQIERALARRRAFARQHTLQFAHIAVGKPQPLDDSPAAADIADGLRGKPVSPGRVCGVARVARTLEDAAAIEPGDILIAPVTDVGWTPYFNLIGGLATDVGSAISHGAVVAREYGLPAVVNLKRATRVFRTGDRVVLDGTHGLLFPE